MRAALEALIAIRYALLGVRRRVLRRRVERTRRPRTTAARGVSCATRLPRRGRGAVDGPRDRAAVLEAVGGPRAARLAGFARGASASSVAACFGGRASTRRGDLELLGALEERSVVVRRAVLAPAGEVRLAAVVPEVPWPAFAWRGTVRSSFARITRKPARAALAARSRL